VKEFEIVKSTFTLGNLRKREVEDSADHYEVDVKSEHGWHFQAHIVVPVAYPRHPPIFTVNCVKTSPKQQAKKVGLDQLPPQMSHLMVSEFERMEELRNKVYPKAGAGS
jgi:hypothetical protein